MLRTHVTDSGPDESPFYLAQQTRYPQPDNLYSRYTESFNQRARDDTENDDLRGVIDDLTVENKKLKTAMRTWRTRPSNASSNPDRIFEIRMHGMPTEKKRELEELLRKFATGLGASSSQPSSSGPVTKSTSSVGHFSEGAKKLQPDPTPADSGYASLSHSGMNSTSQGANESGLSDREPLSKSKKDTDIKKFLHDIPDSLFPRETVSISDNDKMQLVVHRLEHLFIGKRAAPGEHSLPRQQQQISRCAAAADRRENRRLNRIAKTEGTREAHIIPAGSNIYVDASEANEQRPSNPPGSDYSLTEITATPNTEQPGSPDQRPTRPLDLDIHRAQVASDNIEYIRHLGLFSPQFEDSVHSKGQPWMYLNLLVSMAQLHTLNVTPAFVRKAVRQLSTQFELSKDGHKIRWIGDRNVVDNGSTHQVSPETAFRRTSEDIGDDGGRRSGRSTTSTVNVSVSISDDKHFHPKSSNNSRLMNFTTASSYPTNTETSTTQSKATSTFDYKPVVFQGTRTFLKAQESYLDSSGSYEGLSPKSSGLANALNRSGLESQEDSYEGCMTFFNNPHFFTDLSGDKAPTAVRSQGHLGARDVLGLGNEQRLPVDDTLRDVEACYFLTPRPHECTNWPHDSPQIEMSMLPIKSGGEDETRPMELDASGIGGVRPEDNFALDVQVARSRPSLDYQKRSTKLVQTLPYSYQVIGCTKLDLQPSRLPSPSYVFFSTSSSSEADRGHQNNDDDSEESSEAEVSAAPAGFLWQWSTTSNEQPGGDDDDRSEASSSLGVLEAARARLPRPGPIDETVRPVGGSLAAIAGASWSAASNAPEPDMGRDLDDDESVDSMSVEDDL